MTAGKLLHSLKDANGTVDSIAFNPCEFVIASASSDSVIRVYDLQTFDLISNFSTHADTVSFSPDGQDLLSAGSTSLQVFGWEPLLQKSQATVQWSSIKDIKFLPDTTKVIGCSTNGNFVDVWGFRLDVSRINSERDPINNCG